MKFYGSNLFTKTGSTKTANIVNKRMKQILDKISVPKEICEHFQYFNCFHFR